jgi:hypothetical protein
MWQLLVQSDMVSQISEANADYILVVCILISYYIIDINIVYSLIILDVIYDFVLYC